MLLTAFHGLCMAVSDSVPGVSGGTIAFILGFYDNFINALHDLFGRGREKRKNAVIYLLKLGIGWCVGMVLCILALSSLFESHIYFLSSVFLGLTVAAVPFVAVSEKECLKGRYVNLLFSVLGLVLVVVLSMLRSGSGLFGNMDFASLKALQYVYLFVTGMIAITAMVLPGISGSTVLLITGVYMPVITAVKELLKFNLKMLPGIMVFGFGIIVGIGLSISFIRKALKSYRSQMVYLILGLMLGSLYAIVQGAATLDTPKPALGFSTFSIAGFILGLAVLFGLELLRRATEKKNAK